MLRAFGLTLALAVFSATAQAPLDIRLALVIGNGAYAGAPLPNPANDAHAMANTLKQLGFAVIELQNGNRAQMAEAIINIRESLRGKQAIGMLYYAGHGLQLDWRNYMVPVDAKLNSAGDVAQQTVAVANKEGIVQQAGQVRFRLGDVVHNVVRDGYTGNELRRTRGEVTKVGPERVEINNGALIRTPEGGTIRNPFFTNADPPRLDLPAGEYVLGKKWTYRSIETGLRGQVNWTEGEVKIVALEDITVPAGTFKTCKLVLEQVAQNGFRTRFTRWVEPDWGFFIKQTTESIPRTGPAERLIYEMVERERGAG